MINILKWLWEELSSVPVIPANPPIRVVSFRNNRNTMNSLIEAAADMAGESAIIARELLERWYESQARFLRTTLTGWPLERAIRELDREWNDYLKRMERINC